jgi:hypothetical protein
MKDFDVSTTLEALCSLEERIARWDCLEVDGPIDDGDLAEIVMLVEALKVTFKQAKYYRPLTAIRTTLLWSKTGKPLYAAAISEMRHVVEAVKHELTSHQFYALSSPSDVLFDRANLFGKEVTDAFPSASFDIQEAGSCLATDRYTAAVFHLMRAVEWCLRALCKDVGLNRSHQKNKSGKVKYTPISYADWELMLSQLHPKIDAKMNRMRKGKQKQEAQEFYYPILQDLRAFRDAWRNHVMHTRAQYSQSEATTVLDHVRRFFRSLALKVKEV